jgi:AcrR family transcriptional regulator
MRVPGKSPERAAPPGLLTVKLFLLPSSPATQYIAISHHFNHPKKISPMHISPRILREEADALTNPRDSWTARQWRRHATIIFAGGVLLARHGKPAITMQNLALALAISPATLKKHFVDLDALIGEILTRYLRRLARIVNDIPDNHPQRYAARRQAYAKATRAKNGACNDAHRLLMRETANLPGDLREKIEAAQRALTASLAPGQGEQEQALPLPDAAFIPASAAKTLLAAPGKAANRPQPPSHAPAARPKPRHRGISTTINRLITKAAGHAPSIMALQDSLRQAEIPPLHAAGAKPWPPEAILKNHSVGQDIPSAARPTSSKMQIYT